MSATDPKPPPPQSAGPEEIELPPPKAAGGDGVPRAGAVEENTERAGEIIDGRYRILGVVGRGGMGTVYKAEHKAIGRVVALKLLHGSLAQVPEVIRRFEREAFAIGRIEHPNCVNVSDFGNLPDGSLFLVMEYLEGRALSDELSGKGRLPAKQSLHILRHVLRGLGHAHANDIVHRDVKPENVVIIDYDGDPNFAKILDFGIAKLVGNAAEAGGRDNLTQAGMAFGTPIYMSPEQALGQPIDGRADLYAASVMAYEMITGQPPFQSDDKMEVMTMHASKPAPPMSETAPDLDIPAILEGLIMRGLAKRPSERYADAAAFIAAVDETMATLWPPSDARPMSPPQGTGNFATPVYQSPHSSQAAPYAPPPPGMSSSGLNRPLTANPNPTMATPLPVLFRRWRPLALGAGLVLLLGLVVTVLSSGSDGDAAQSDAGVESASAGMPLAEHAATLLAKGAPQEAIEYLGHQDGGVIEDADALLQLGHAHAALRDNAEAVDAYRRALERDPALASDTKLRTNLRLMVDDRGSVAAVEAARLMIDPLGEEDLAEPLLNWASSDKSLQVRHSAVKAAEELGLGERIDRTQTLLMDLWQEKSCERRRGVIGKLRALGDPRAIDELRKVRGRPKNGCLRRDATEAMEYLTRLRNEAAQAADAGSD
ncbi:protein kinase domain-containing protein [Haliangium ochraceum]|uniref:non-specific serine/threonine protein kinase n=1 Tax=Haliangium ochraceum (strain DSM 14365 / JCM 11303 / SMP-2) TaxID=502025 RepID=D0LQ23_HALO1|nr:protein kinase [Haliangium ochraceum]ACY17060.1 serine/threonine protein kinase with TPR repeats [Haliangium ochraceum DSM 14365]